MRISSTFLFRLAITIIIVGIFFTVSNSSDITKHDLQVLAKNLEALNEKMLSQRNVFQEVDKFMQPIARVNTSIGRGTAVAILVKEGHTYFLTANHVVEGDNNVDLTLFSGEILDNAEVIANNPEKDLALVKVKGIYAIAKLAAREPGLFTRVVAVGCPLGLMPTPTEGILVGKNGEHLEDLWYYTAPTVFGNSGGAVYTADGKLVGISVRIVMLRVGLGAAPVYHLGLFVPLPTITTWLGEVLEQE